MTLACLIGELVSFYPDESPTYYIEGGAAPSGTTSSVFEIPIGKNSQALSVTKISEVAVGASSQIPCVTQQGIHPADQGTAGNLGASLLSLAGSNPGQETRDLTLPPIVI